MLKILLGLLPPTSGTAKVMDFDVASQGIAIRQFVGYMPEHDCLPPDVSATEFVTHMARDVRPAGRCGAASGRPRSFATSGCTRSAIEPSAGIRPACASA